jgi:hypothetical protein
MITYPPQPGDYARVSVCGLSRKRDGVGKQVLARSVGRGRICALGMGMLLIVEE